ncbi:MAG: endonuclease/exonuclease/phosphatase family protein [Rhodobacter sp.]|nr:endonuclease/exonuclease/phosphatase family protein [Rhodobacter sp.]
MRGILLVLTLASLLALLAGFGGALHPFGDALAVFRLQVGVMATTFALALRLTGMRIGLVLAIVALIAIAPAIWQRVGPVEVPNAALTVYQKNLSFRLADTGPVTRDIIAQNPDVVTLQEVTQANFAVLDALKETHPTQVHCPFVRVGAVVILSRWPAVKGSELCVTGQGLAAVQVTTPRGDLWLVSMHMYWPWPYRQAEQLGLLLPELSALKGPMIVAGDFNMVPGGYSLRAIAGATDTRRARPALNSFPRFSPWIPMPIDHVFAPGLGAVELRPEFGSDHRGILVRIEHFDFGD